jgi:hypothetical protein
MLRKTVASLSVVWALVASNPFEGIDTVKVFSESQKSQIQSALDPQLPIPTTLDSSRLAVLLEPGDYTDLELHVGYFTSVAGLGARPSDVKNGHVRIDTVGSNRGDTTTIFWRSVENMETNMTTHCSQGVSFRRILSDNFIHDTTTDAAGHGGGSGGFIADCFVRDDPTTNFAVGGQQYFVRNLRASALTSNTFNTLYLGCQGSQAAASDQVSYIDETPSVAEKPYIVKDSSGNWSLVKPTLRFNAQGPTFDQYGDPVTVQGESIDFSQIFIAKEGTTAAEINEQIAASKHILLAPYVYHLEDSIHLNRSGTVFLGLGLATLECADQKPCLVVGAVDDVRVAGITVVGAVESSNDAWVQVGDPASPYDGDAGLPTILSDIHFIVGYYRHNYVRASMQINNGHVLLDHSWSWRSDIDGAHGESRNGYEVHGDHVTTYGLFSEHHWQYSLAWYGNYGRNYFYQCETPWDAANGALEDWTQPESSTNTWRYWPAPNWYTIKPRCYYVDDAVTHFFGASVGAYSMEGGGCSSWCGCQATQALDTHIQVPSAPDVQLLRVTCWKNCGGGVQHCVNDGVSDPNWIVHTNWCNGHEVLGAVSGAQCSQSTGNCSAYMNSTGCRWTNSWSCPGQPLGSQGSAADDGTDGYDCCCNQGLWHTCGDLGSSGCDWTKQYSCPGEPTTSETVSPAASDGTLGYNCCCEQEYWKDWVTFPSVV